jgi:gluconate transporter
LIPGPYLAALTIGAIALLVFLILFVRLHAFIALLITSLALGLAAGLPPDKVLKSMQAGIGEALSFISVVIALGAMIGRFVEQSGGGRVLANWMLAQFGERNAPWAVLISSFLVGLPVFFDVGFVMLAPVVWELAKESKRSLLFFGMPLAAAMTMTHTYIPPHPGAAIAVQLFSANLGLTILYGTAMAIPVSIIGGMVYGGWLARRNDPPLPAAAHVPVAQTGDAPSVSRTVAILLLPVLLIFAATLALLLHVPGKPFWDTIGHPFTALTVTVLAAMVWLGTRRGMTREAATKLATDSLGPMATIIMVVGGGGAFKQVIVDSGVASFAGGHLTSWALSPILICFVTGAVMRAALGSGTVSIVAAAGLLAPILKNIGGYSPEMLVLAVCCGGSTIAHVNDPGFWLVKEYFGLNVPQAFQSWTVMKFVCGLSGILILVAVQAFT